MPRISRGLADGHCYHILNRGNGRQQVFHKDDDYRAFIDLLGETTKRYPIELFAYCLMPNHFHLPSASQSPAAFSLPLEKKGSIITKSKFTPLHSFPKGPPCPA